MSTFRGEFNCSVDDKGRIKLPVSLKAQFPEVDGGRFMLKKGLDDCLEIYPLATWQEEENKLRKLDRFNPAHRAFSNAFTAGITEVALDGSDRFLVPKSLVKYLGNTREVILKGELDCIQIWDVQRYEQFLNGNLGNIHDLSVEISKYLNEQETKK